MSSCHERSADDTRVGGADDEARPLDVGRARHDPRWADATLVGRQQYTAALARFRVIPDGGPVSFVAGQYATLALADASAPPRPYPISSCPGARELDFVISLVPDGALTPRLFELGVGSRVHLGPVRGLFRLDGDDHRDHILIGTGSGIAPLSAMLAELRARREPPRTTLLHGARVRAELAGGVETDEHDRAWFSYQPSLSCALTSDAWRGRTGRVSTSLRNLIAVGDLAPDRTVAYLCGSPGMIDECRSLLAPAGVPPDAIRTERFTAS